MTGRARRVSGPGGRLGVAAAGLALLCVPAAAAQQPKFETAPGQDGIVVERLEPLMREGELTPDDRFKPAPFKTPEMPMVPELIAPVETVQKPGARLRQLDKMTGQAETVEVAAGGEVMLDRLRVRLEACRAPENNGEHGTMAFLEIWDSEDSPDVPVFSGWMFADSPALSAMDHPRYDVWVMSCTTASGDGSTASR